MGTCASTVHLRKKISKHPAKLTDQFTLHDRMEMGGFNLSWGMHTRSKHSKNLLHKCKNPAIRIKQPKTMCPAHHPNRHAQTHKRSKIGSKRTNVDEPWNILTVRSTRTCPLCFIESVKTEANKGIIQTPIKKSNGFGYCCSRNTQSSGHTFLG